MFGFDGCSRAPLPAVADLPPLPEQGGVAAPRVNGNVGVAIDPAASRVFAAFAAGSGITPILSIMKTVLAREPASTYSQRIQTLLGMHTTPPRP